MLWSSFSCKEQIKQNSTGMFGITLFWIKSFPFEIDAEVLSRIICPHWEDEPWEPSWICVQLSRLPSTNTDWSNTNPSHYMPRLSTGEELTHKHQGSFLLTQSPSSHPQWGWIIALSLSAWQRSIVSPQRWTGNATEEHQKQLIQ